MDMEIGIPCDVLKEVDSSGFSVSTPSVGKDIVSVIRLQCVVIYSASRENYV